MSQENCPTQEQFEQLRDKIIAKHQLNLENNTPDKAWLTRILWRDETRRRNHVASKTWQQWFGYPYTPSERPVRWTTLNEILSWPTEQVRSEIEAVELWKHPGRMPEEQEDGPPEWYVTGRLPGKVSHYEYE